MLKADARAIPVESSFDHLLVELTRLHETLSLEQYLLVLDRLADQARKSLGEVRDPEEQDRLREQYRQVIEFAVDITCGNLH